MLDVLNIAKRFDDGELVLADIDLTVTRGQIVCLLGPSGCGKTTLLRIIAGLETQDQGRVLCEGIDLARVPVHLRNFGLMFQDFALFPHRTVGENIGFGLRMEGRSPAAIATRVAEMLDLIELPPAYADRSIFELSGGERQRVALARSLAPNPRLLMLDEPLGNLDRALRERLMLDLRTILKRIGVTAVYVTHDQAEAYAVADRIVLMNHGRIIQDAPPHVLYTQPATPFVARFLGFDNLLPATVTADGAALRTSLGDLPRPNSATDCPPGSECVLLIHPEAGTLASHTLEDAQPVTVETVSFRGDHFEVECTALVDGTTTPLRFDIATYATMADPDLRLEPGRLLYLTIDPQKLTMLPRA